MNYKVEIIETLQTIIEVDSSDEEAALIHVMQLYRDEKIVLDSSNFIDVSTSIVN